MLWFRCIYYCQLIEARSCHMASQNLVSIASGNGLLPDGTKPLPEPMLTCHQSGSVAVTRQHKLYQGMLKISITEICLKSVHWTLLPHLPETNELTHCDLVMPCGDIDLGQNWFRQWIVAWRHQTITWTNVDLGSVAFTWEQSHSECLGYHCVMS